MKRIIILATAICFGLAISALAQEPVDLTGEMMASGYLGYSIGLGDMFKDYTEAYYEYSAGAGLSLGGTFHYGLKENIMLGGELMIQSYKFESEYKGTPVPGVELGEFSDSETEVNILATGLYAMNYTDEKSFFLTGGVGFYDSGGMKLGLNAGIVYSMEVSPKISIFGMPRFHIVFADDTFELLQLAVGAQFSVGPGQ